MVPCTVNSLEKVAVSAFIFTVTCSVAPCCSWVVVSPSVAGHLYEIF